MAQVPEKYVGREQTLVKHLFLTQYLRKAAFMVFQGRANTFNFVDAFAGPWSLADNTDFTDSSFDQAIRTLDPVRDYLEQRGVTGRRLRFRFCEKKPDRCAQLRDYAQRQSVYDIKVYEGAFEDHADEIEDDCRLGFTFTFIDPTGFKLRSADIARFLAKTRSEFLLNFMADHVNRSAGWGRGERSLRRAPRRSQVAGPIRRLAGDPTATGAHPIPVEAAVERTTRRHLHARLRDHESGRRAREDAARPRHPQVAWR